MAPLFPKGDLLLAAEVSFFTNLERAAPESIDENALEGIVVEWRAAGREPSPSDTARLVLGYVVKISPNFGSRASGGLEAFWSELLDCAGGSYAEVGPPFVRLIPEGPGQPTKQYSAELRQKGSRVFVLSPYRGRGGEAYYASLSAFALIRSARARLGALASSLDNAMTELCGALERGDFDPEQMRGLANSSAIADAIAVEAFANCDRPANEGPEARERKPPARNESEDSMSQSEPTEEELESKRRALRYRIVEAAESAGWDISLHGEDIVLGNGRVHVQAMDDNRVLLYSMVDEASFSPEDVPEINADIPTAAFLARYVDQQGSRRWGLFQRLSIPLEGVEVSELGRWLHAGAVDLLISGDMLMGDDASG